MMWSPVSAAAVYFLLLIAGQSFALSYFDYVVTDPADGIRPGQVFSTIQSVTSACEEVWLWWVPNNMTYLYYANQSDPLWSCEPGTNQYQAVYCSAAAGGFNKSMVYLDWMLDPSFEEESLNMTYDFNGARLVIIGGMFLNVQCLQDEEYLTLEIAPPLSYLQGTVQAGVKEATKYTPGDTILSISDGQITNEGPSNAKEVTCDVVIHPEEAASWIEVTEAGNSSCSTVKDNTLRCGNVAHLLQPQENASLFSSASLRTNPWARGNLTISVENCTVRFEAVDQHLQYVVPMGELDIQVNVTVTEVSAEAKETRRQVMEETSWRVELSNGGKSSSLKTGCSWSLPASQSTAQLTLPAECWLSSAVDNSTGATVECLTDLAPHSSKVFTLALPSWSSILCLDETGSTLYQLQAEEQTRAEEEDRDSNAVGLGVGLGVGLFCLLLLVVIAIAAVIIYRKKHASGRDAIADVETGPVEYTMKRGTSKKSGKRDKKEVKFSWEIPFEELDFGNELGRGAFGIVWKGTWRESPVAIKQVLGITTGAEMEDFKSEIQIMKNLRPHANVLQLRGVASNETNLYCVTEFMGKGDLASFLRSKEGEELAEDEATLIRWAKEIAAGMHHLHQEGIVHRDLAARNLLLTANLVIKVSDFGLAKKGLEDEAESSGSSSTELGPLKWMAPECFTERQYSEKTDVWSYGVCLWELLTKGTEPHPELSPQEAVLALVEEGQTLAIPEDAPPVLQHVITSCFKVNPAERPTFKEILVTLKKANRK